MDIGSLYDSRMKIIAAPCLAILMVGCSSLESASRLDSFSQNLLPQTKTLRVISINGDIVISGLTAHNDINVDVDYFAQADSLEDAQKSISLLIVTSSYAAGGIAILEVTGPDTHCGANLSLQVPEGVNLDIRAGNGDVYVVPVVNTLTVRTVNGDVILNSHSKVRVKTTNGDIVLEGNSADFDLRSENGDINLTQSASFSGSGSMTTTNGSLHVSNSETIDAKIHGGTGNGNYMIYGPPLSEDQGTGLIRLNTTNGDINITHNEMPAEVE
jgi:DUF4097 and DUF4098 domain-containing protein YvlB